VSRRNWVRLDNASNIFLAARTDVDPKVFRLGAEMDEEVDAGLLQAALEEVYDRFPLYHAVLRRGVFWYYLQDSDLIPRVAPETEPSCSPLYQVDHRTLLFRVLHHEKRISLEVFHALSDGTGALWFLTELLAAYARRRASAPAHPAPRGPRPAPPLHTLTTDSFAHYFRRRRRPAEDPAHAREFTRDAAPAALTVAGAGPTADGPAGAAPAPPPATRRRGRVHRVRGTRTPDHRTRVLELTMPTAQVLALARTERVALTMYLTALFLESVRRAAGGAADRSRLVASVPVNLRQFFPSTSARNFFATTSVEHTFGDDETLDQPEEIARSLQQAFDAEAAPAALAQRLRGLQRVERSPFARIVPRPLKDVILGLVNRGNNRHLTVAVSNLGRVVLPEPADSQVRRLQFHVSAARPQFCAISHGEHLTVTFTSPFVETDHVREFARLLTARGVDVTVAAPRTTEAELAETEDEEVER